MDVASLMNDDGPPPEKSQSPGLERRQHGQAPATVVNGVPTTPSHPGSYQPSPGRPSSGALAGHRAQSQGLPQLQTGSQGPPAGVYAHPSRMSQSPAAATQGHFPRPLEAYPNNVHGMRAQTQYPSFSPSAGPPTGLPHGLHARSIPSTSPTPSPSHHSHTPHSHQQSPLSGTALGAPSQHHYQPMQPSTPLGPPSLHYQRSATHSDLQSPMHQRTNSSGASNGFIHGSPAQYHASIGNLVESPGQRPRPSQGLRRQGESPMQDRERSVSISPKTQVMSQTPRAASRQVSHHEPLSSRSSVQATAPGTESPSHVTAPNLVAQVSQPLSLPQSASNSVRASSVAEEPPVSQRSSHAGTPGTIQHHSRKMDMNQLLTPTSDVPQAWNATQGSAMNRETSTHASVKPQAIESSRSPTSVAPQPQLQRSLSQQRELDGRKSPAQPAALPQRERDSSQHGHSETMVMDPAPAASRQTSLKRSASDAISEPPAKQRRTTRKYVQRPPWAQISRHNHLSRQQAGQNKAAATSLPRKPPPAQPHPPPEAHVNGTAKRQVSAQPAAPGPGQDGTPAWLRDPPLDFDLMHARRLLGKWEKSFMWNTPVPDLDKRVQDWIFIELDRLADVGTDPREGAIEIEAKIGTLIQDNGERCALPVTTATVIDPRANNRYRFESQMTEAEHQSMNTFLNKSLLKASEKGRAHMQYKHTYETDTFAPLSTPALTLIPAAIQKRMPSRPLNLRTTTDTKTGAVLARIVKVALANLHIYNPAHTYDCRLTINLELNLLRADVGDPAALVDGPTDAKPAQPTRVKDRMAYKHLAYEIDLTKVERQGLSPSFELEVEVDAERLREQWRAVREGRESAYGSLVSGLLDNVTYLMRQEKLA